MNKKRFENIVNQMNKENLKQLIITSSAPIFYLTGQWISSGERLLVLYLNELGEAKLIINELFPIDNIDGIEIIRYKDTDEPINILKDLILEKEDLGIDKDWPAKFLLKLMDTNNVNKFINSSSIIDEVRMCKDEEEKVLMREASAINDIVMEKIQGYLKIDVTEKEICSELLRLYEENNASGFSFEPIVAFGKNGADPHHSSGNSKLKNGDPITIDTGCKYKHYCSDMTRSFIFNKTNKEYEDVYNIVLEANKLGIEAVKAGAKFSDIDNATRDYIESKGYGEFFTHRTGHSIGIEVHEFGDVSSINDDLLKAGMIFSVEPGVYIPGKFGIRIEDLILVTEDGYENLNKVSKELKII